MLEGFEPRQTLSSADCRAPSRASRATTRMATRVGPSSPALGSSGAPHSSLLPTTRGPAPAGEIVEDADELVLDEAALLLDDEDVLEPVGKTPRALGLERPGQPDLVERDAERRARRVVDAELGQRLAQIEIGLAGGDDAEARRLGGRSRCGRTALARAKAATAAIFGPCSRRSCSSGVSGQRMLRPPGGISKSAGRTTCDAVRIDVDRGRAFDRLGDRLEADPAAGKARQREAEQAEIEIFLHRRRD